MSAAAAIVAYTKFDPTFLQRHVWQVPQAGGAAVQVTSGAVLDQYPMASPDGSRIVFQRASLSLMVCNADGSGLTDITPAGGIACRWPSWHPTLKRIVFTRGNDVCHIDDDGTDFTILAVGGAGAQKAKPHYNRDGALIGYLDQTGFSTYRLHTMNADGTGDAAIGSTVVRVSGTDFNWLNASDVLVYGYVSAARNYFKINADGTGNTQLDTPALTNKSVLLYPGMAPDDSFCVFSRFNGSTGWNLYKLPIDGSGQTISSPLLTTNGANGDGPLMYGSRIYVNKVVGGVVTTVSVASDWSDERTEDTPADQIQLRFT